jgi:hypothetical protein
MKTALFLAIPVVLLAQPAQPVAQDPAKSRLEGQVLNSVTKEPLRKARLTLQLNAAALTTYPATSDAMGRFVFANVDPGDYELAIRHDGFADLVLGAKRPLPLGAGDRKSDFQVRLVPYGSIAGSVLDEDGDPLRNIAVAAMTWHYTSGGRELEEARTATSNDLGEYRIFDLPAGKYFLKAGRRGLNLSAGPEDSEAFGSVFYPGLPQVSGATVQEVAPGAQLRNLNFNLRKIHYATLRGRVVAPANATGVYAGLMVVNGNSSSSSVIGTKGKDFQFEFFGVAPGSIYLTGRYVLDGLQYHTVVPIDVGDSDIEGIELRPGAPMEVVGHVRIVGETKVDVSQAGLTLEGRGIGGVNADVQPDGTYVFRDVVPGAYRVYLYLPGVYVKSIHWGTTDITDATLDLTSGVPSGTELSMVLGADGGQISGVVTNENGDLCDGVTVTLIPTGAHRSRSFYEFDTTEASGKFTITGITPGTYKLLAWDNVDNNAVIYDPDFLHPYESGAQTVEILANDKKTVDLKLTLNREP